MTLAQFQRSLTVPKSAMDPNTNDIGENSPSGPSLKLLNVIGRKGVKALA
jgi:DNA-binding transcriptional regulator YiaG